MMDLMKKDEIIKPCDINKWGLNLLRTITPHNSALSELKHKIENYKTLQSYNDDIYAWLTVILALRAANMGNFGVGALLINGDRDIVTVGHNQVFEPYFRSDLHAEMVVMNQVETNIKEIGNLEGYTIYTSLEPCPMCFTRLLTSGVGTILQVAPDYDGGMVHKIKDLPPVWRALSERKVFAPAKCSKTMTDIAGDIFNYSESQLHSRLKQN